MNPHITKLLLEWWSAEKTDMPWRNATDPYHIWVSEVMLQQTQVATVIPYYERWIAQFPTVTHLAEADLNTVLKLWEGLGYYSRARNLHKAAQEVVERFGGELPADLDQLRSLPGIGAYTAGAIASIAFNIPTPVVDGNVIRVLTRLHDVPDDVTKSATKKRLWVLAGELVPNEPNQPDQRPGDFNQALMELGQKVCQPRKPHCHFCVIEPHCLARERGTQLDRPVKPPRKNTPHYDVAAGVIYRDDGRFLITRRPLDGLLGGLWEFPGGKQEPNETLEETLVREIMEEVAIEIKPNRLITQVKHAYTHFRITLHTFHATYITGDIQHLGCIDHAWVTLNDLDEYAFAVTDLKIIATLRSKFA